jgi:hypothetical protein
VVEMEKDLSLHIKTLKDNFGADFYAVDFGFKKQKTWNLLIKEFGFKVCKNKRYLENEFYYINNNMYLTYLTITKK